jgi:hypothetical protein
MVNFIKLIYFESNLINKRSHLGSVFFNFSKIAKSKFWIRKNPFISQFPSVRFTKQCRVVQGSVDINCRGYQLCLLAISIQVQLGILMSNLFLPLFHNGSTFDPKIKSILHNLRSRISTSRTKRKWSWKLIDLKSSWKLKVNHFTNRLMTITFLCKAGF